MTHTRELSLPGIDRRLLWRCFVQNFVRTCVVAAGESTSAEVGFSARTLPTYTQWHTHKFIGTPPNISFFFLFWVCRFFFQFCEGFFFYLAAYTYKVSKILPLWEWKFRNLDPEGGGGGNLPIPLLKIVVQEGRSESFPWCLENILWLFLRVKNGGFKITIKTKILKFRPSAQGGVIIVPTCNQMNLYGWLSTRNWKRVREQ